MLVATISDLTYSWFASKGYGSNSEMRGLIYPYQETWTEKDGSGHSRAQKPPFPISYQSDPGFSVQRCRQHKGGPIPKRPRSGKNLNPSEQMGACTPE